MPCLRLGTTRPVRKELASRKTSRVSRQVVVVVVVVLVLLVAAGLGGSSGCWNEPGEMPCVVVWGWLALGHWIGLAWIDC
jgi:hypothetical protein